MKVGAIMTNKQYMEKLGKKPSIIRQLFHHGLERKKIVGEDKVYDFSLGNPNIPCPQIVTDKLIELLTTQDSVQLHGYSVGTGHSEIRESVANYLNETYNTKEKASLIYLTAGAAGGLAACFHALLEEGEEVIVFAPFWPEYTVLVENAHGVLVPVLSDLDTFMPDFDAFEKAINEKTKFVVVNSPNNPTGVIYSEETIKKIAKILNKKQQEYNHPIYLLSDEPYRELIFNNEKYPFITNYYNNALVTYSFSKCISIPGARIGYVVVGRDCEDASVIFDCIKGAGRALGYVCAPTLFQYLIPHCQGYTSDLNSYKENQEILYNHLVKIGYKVAKPEGAFYLFVKALEDSSMNFSEEAKKLDLLLVPSDSFGLKGYVRIAYCVSKDTVINSLPVFEKLYQIYIEKGETNE